MSIYELCETLQADLERSTNRSHALPVSLHNIIALRYYASGSYMNVVGDAQWQYQAALINFKMFNWLSSS